MRSYRTLGFVILVAIFARFALIFWPTVEAYFNEVSANSDIMKVGDKVPDFECLDQNGETFKVVGKCAYRLQKYSIFLCFLVTSFFLGSSFLKFLSMFLHLNVSHVDQNRDRFLCFPRLSSVDLVVFSPKFDQAKYKYHVYIPLPASCCRFQAAPPLCA